MKDTIVNIIKKIYKIIENRLYRKHCELYYEIYTDYFRRYGDDKISYRSIKRILKDEYYGEYGFRFVLWYRFAQHANEFSSSVRNKILNQYRRVSLDYGVEIDDGTEIGKGFIVWHTNGIVINRNAVIGDNFEILQQVTIGNGSTKEGEKELAPCIGNNVSIYAGAKVVGNIRIGNNVSIGANAVVIKDIPENCTAVGVPQKIIHAQEKEVTNGNYLSFEEWKKL